MSPEQRDGILKERRGMEEQAFRGAATNGNPRPVNVDAEQHSERLHDWLEKAKWGSDVRNRIAVAGNGVGQGRFGELHLIAPNEIRSISLCDEQQSTELLRGTAANDEVFIQPAVSRSQGR